MPGTRVRPSAGPRTSLEPGIHVFMRRQEKDVDGRDKPGHDEWRGPTQAVETTHAFSGQALRREPEIVVRIGAGRALLDRVRPGFLYRAIPAHCGMAG